MTISIQRLTLFAIFDALEKDLRSVLRLEVYPDTNLTYLLNEQEYTKVHQRSAKADSTTSIEPDDDDRLLHFLDFLDVLHIINRNQNKLHKPLSDYFSRITPTLEKCAPVRNAVMHGRPLEIDEFPTICQIASSFAADHEFSWKHLTEALSEIENDSSYVFGLNFTITDESPSGAFHNLPTPDFDDTGFVGRHNVLQQVEGAIEGPFPVISLVGPGGVGKTALALKVAYQLLAREDLQFDALVWVSAKASTLTATEIKRIEGAIEDSVGVFNTIMSEFEPNSMENPEDRTIDLLSSFNILLILDNLETALDERLRMFIQKIPKGSKILITSRIGISAGDLSIQIPPLTMPESRIYFRKLAQAYDVERLKTINSKTLDRYIRKMISNPLILKWFVTAVKAGSRPEGLLADQSHVLRYCVENVVEELDLNSKLICSAYLVVEGPHSLPMIAQLTDLLPDDIESSLTKLIAYNILTMISVNDLGDTAYKMSELPRAYLFGANRLLPDAGKDITQRYRRVQQTVEQVGRFRGEAIYRFENFRVEDRDQAIVVAELKRAFALIRRKDFEAAESVVMAQGALAPGYFEVERVKAYLKFETGDFVEARRAYERALELAPEYGPLYFWYGGFLMRAYSDLDGALEAFRKALVFQPSTLVRREEARVLLYKGRYNKAKGILDELLEIKSLSKRLVASLEDLRIQYYCRNFEHQMETGDERKALELLIAARQHGESIAADVFDERMGQKYPRIVPKVESLCLRLEGTDEGHTVEEWIAWAGEMASRDVTAAQPGRIGRARKGVSGATIELIYERNEGKAGEYLIGSACEGIVSAISESRTFGFIRTREGDEFFFHQSSVGSRGQCLFMDVETQVQFKVGRNSKGYTATELVIRFEREFEELVEESGRVKACVVGRREGMEYGFAIVADYGQLLIRKEDFMTADQWYAVREGDWVELTVGRGQGGFVGRAIARGMC